jgi:hypothetical protein
LGNQKYAANGRLVMDGAIYVDEGLPKSLVAKVLVNMLCLFVCLFVWLLNGPSTQRGH